MPNTTDIQHTFKHYWKDVFLASWKKYPSPRRPDIVSVDVINKEFDPETGILSTTRLVITERSVPWWLKPVFPSTRAIFVEEAKVDPKNKIMKLYSKNITYDSILKTEETCTYTPSKENSNHTDFHQVCRVSSCVSGLTTSIEDFVIKGFKTNSDKGKEIMESAIQLVENERMHLSSNF